MSSFKFKIKNAYWKTRDKAQKIIRGYSDTDINELFQWFIDTMRPMIKQFRKITNSYPIECLNWREWDKILKEMDNCLYMMDEQHVMDYYGYKYNNLTVEQNMKIHQEMEKNKDNFFNLFKKYFYEMWN